MDCDSGLRQDGGFCDRPDIEQPVSENARNSLCLRRIPRRTPQDAAQRDAVPFQVVHKCGTPLQSALPRFPALSPYVDSCRSNRTLHSLLRTTHASARTARPSQFLPSKLLSLPCCLQGIARDHHENVTLPEMRDFSGIMRQQGRRQDARMEHTPNDHTDVNLIAVYRVPDTAQSGP